MAARDARNIMKMSTDEVWDLDGPMTLKFDDGTVKTTARAVIFSYYIWEFHRRYPKTPMLVRHMLKGTTIGTGTHIDLLSEVLSDCYEIYKGEGIDREELWKLAYDVSNNLYNDMTFRLEPYVTSISALDFLEVVDHPTVREVNTNVKPNNETDTDTVDNAYAKIKRVLLDAPELSHNGVAKAARSGLVSMGQILQCVGPRGYTTDIDSNIFPKPILAGFFEGLRSLEDMMKESRSAAKALFFTKDPMQKSEYFNRNIQLSAATLMNLHHGDCGSKHFIPFTVKPGDLRPGLDGIYYRNDKGKLERITKGHGHLIGKTIMIRSVFGCEHPDPYGICSTCFGDLALSVPRDTNIGHISSTVVQSDIGQRLLSTKHEDQSSTVETQPLDKYTALYIKAFDDPNHLGLKPKAMGDKVELWIPEESAKNLFDVSYVDDVANLVVTRITSISEIQLVIKRGKSEEIAVLNVANGPREASLSHAALAYVKEKGWTMSSEGHYIIDMTQWDLNKILFELPLKHHSMVEYMKLIEKVIKGTGERSLKTLVDFDDPAQALAQFYDLVSSKMDVSLSHLQVVLLSTMARDMDHDDYRLPKPGFSGKFASYKMNMGMRSLAPMMAYQRQAPTLESVKSFTVKVRPKHPLDHLLMP